MLIDSKYNILFRESIVIPRFCNTNFFDEFEACVNLSGVTVGKDTRALMPLRLKISTERIKVISFDKFGSVGYLFTIFVFA